MKGIYNKNAKLDFGMYKGYELGIVYVFDPLYIDWCINNIDRFYISDFNELKEYGVINKDLNWQYRLVGEASYIPNIDRFKSFNELLENIDLGNNRFEFSPETLQKHKKKSKIGISNTNRSTSIDDEVPRYEKYGGYKGFDDDTIDNAFDGEPMNTWNID